MEIKFQQLLTQWEYGCCHTSLCGILYLLNFSRSFHCGFDPWPHSVGWGSGVAVSSGVGHRCGLDAVLL